MGYRESWASLGEQVFDREQTPIRNLAADRDQMVFVSGVEGNDNAFANGEGDGYYPKRSLPELGDADM